MLPHDPQSTVILPLSFLPCSLVYQESKRQDWIAQVPFICAGLLNEKKNVIELIFTLPLQKGTHSVCSE